MGRKVPVLNVNVASDDLAPRRHGGPRSGRRTFRDNTDHSKGGGANKPTPHAKRIPKSARSLPKARPMSETPEELRVPITGIASERWLRNHLHLDKERDNLAKLKPFRDAVASWPEDSVDPRTGQRSVMGTHKLLAVQRDTQMLHQVAEMYHRQFLATRQKSTADQELSAAQDAYASLGLTKFEISMEEYTKVEGALGMIRRNNQFRPPPLKSGDDIVTSLDRLKDRYYITRTDDNTRRMGGIGVDVSNLPFEHGGPTTNRVIPVPEKKKSVAVIEAEMEEESRLRQAQQEVNERRWTEDMAALERVFDEKSEAGSSLGGSRGASRGGTGHGATRASAPRQDARDTPTMSLSHPYRHLIEQHARTLVPSATVGKVRMRHSEMAEERSNARSSAREDPCEEEEGSRAATADNLRNYQLAALTPGRRKAGGGKGRLEGVEQMSVFVSASSMYSPERRFAGGVGGNGAAGRG